MQAGYPTITAVIPRFKFTRHGNGNIYRKPVKLFQREVALKEKGFYIITLALKDAYKSFGLMAFINAPLVFLISF